MSFWNEASVKGLFVFWSLLSSQPQSHRLKCWHERMGSHSSTFHQFLVGRELGSKDGARTNTWHSSISFCIASHFGFHEIYIVKVTLRIHHVHRKIWAKPGLYSPYFLALYNMNLAHFRHLSNAYLFGLIFELVGKPDLSCWAIRCFRHALTLSSLDHSDKQKTELYVFSKLPDMTEFWLVLHELRIWGDVWRDGPHLSSFDWRCQWLADDRIPSTFFV